jgi:hypothetical protein
VTTAALSATSGRTWTIATTTGITFSGYLPSWADADPSRTDVPLEELHIELSDISHEASFDGQLMRVSPAGIDPGEDSVVLAPTIQCSPYVENSQPHVPVVNIKIFDDLWITDLDPAGAAEVAEKFRNFADLLSNKVVPQLAAARADWAERRPTPDLRE